MTTGSRAHQNTQLRPCDRLFGCWRELQRVRRCKPPFEQTPAFKSRHRTEEVIVSNNLQKTPMRLLTIPEASAILQVSEKTVRRWIYAGELPAAKLGNQWRIRPRDLDDFVRDRLVR